MTTKRKRSQSTSRDGINFVRSLVERQKSTCQEIDLHNDLGNDAYLEFIVAENATGCCVALQIKSGTSYRNSYGNYFFQANRDHFEYWASCSGQQFPNTELGFFFATAGDTRLLC
ncbi:DUF4365 domain-containing protein [Pseudomonas asiatica]|uniref:DUF4365 domain-containing protein n=1 Tax=Pseudomonas asiatica TaxID=2219225 RepID=UPI0037C8FF9E